MKVLIFYATAGGGHKAAAKTIAEEVKKLGHEAVILDGLAHQPKWLQTFFNRGYAFLTDSLPWLWRVVFWLSDRPILNRALAFPLFWSNQAYLRQTIHKYQPDSIVTTYYWASAIRGVLDELKSSAKLTTVVTDKFSPSKIWFLEKDSDYLVFSRQARDVALQCQIPEARIKVFADIVDNRFNHKLSDQMIKHFKKSEGFDPALPLILVVGGGESMPKGKAIVSELLRQNLPAQVAVVCGRNQKLKSKLEKLADKYPGIKIKIYGFVDFMYDLLNSADLVIAKAGPATMTETLLLEKPLLLSHYYWKQELGNVRFVVEHRLGYYEPNPKKLAKLAKELLVDSEARKKLIENNRQMKLKTDSQAIAEYLTESRF